jgi:hypothetical protein
MSRIARGLGIAGGVAAGVALIAILVAALLPGSQPDAKPLFAIVDIERRPMAAVEAGSLPSQELVPLFIRLRRPHLAALARHAGTMAFDVYLCTHPNRRYYGNDLYLDGVRIRRFADGRLIGDARAAMDRAARAASKGEMATIVATVNRGELDDDGPMCGQFTNSAQTGPLLDLSTPARIPPPGPADMDRLGIVVALVPRPPGAEAARFAEQLVEAEAERLGLPGDIWDSYGAPIESRGTSPDQSRQVVIYYDPRQPSEKADQVCRVLAPRGGLRRAIAALAYRRCAAKLGLRPAPEPPAVVRVGPVSHLVEGTGWVRCPSHGDCPELEAARQAKKDLGID